ncbi:uncharacterized protein BO66DRAFT_403635 [Aspergillus aculeatinus CBS 121060]|uniref:Uncharacterized protein n=1 Tax=Aspergillus aculeatinus CBS 121060 TaxID=1448322 RepID=A0ACD1H2S1_9EURO|nr:hypothetical protein BO66DRAFT_403635 [Aspergillus aculeatinus CBS 121060]RAH67683.1 hypothetical protein BO66DRAFT_403635 [Aspergillus aculeatinus CBS 121060]
MHRLSPGASTRNPLLPLVLSFYYMVYNGVAMVCDGGTVGFPYRACVCAVDPVHCTGDGSVAGGGGDDITTATATATATPTPTPSSLDFGVERVGGSCAGVLGGGGDGVWGLGVFE